MTRHEQSSSLQGFCAALRGNFGVTWIIGASFEPGVDCFLSQDLCKGRSKMNPEQPDAHTPQPDVFYLNSSHGTRSAPVLGMVGGGLSSILLGLMVGLVLLCMVGAGLNIVSGQIGSLVPRLNGPQIVNGQAMQVVSKEQ